MKPAPRYRSLTPRQRMLAALGVAGSMLAIVGLYAATMESRLAAVRAEPDRPRWSVPIESLTEKAAPLGQGFAEIREQMDALVTARTVQARSAELLAARLRSATATEETSEPLTPNEP